MIRHLILRGRRIVEVDLRTWALWMEHSTDERVLAQDYLQSERYGTVCCSTVFLGLPHIDFSTGRMDMLFETMVFRERGTDEDGLPPPDDLTAVGFWGEMRRYKTYEEAETGHGEIMRKLLGVPQWSLVPGLDSESSAQEGGADEPK